MANMMPALIEFNTARDQLDALVGEMEEASNRLASAACRMTDALERKTPAGHSNAPYSDLDEMDTLLGFMIGGPQMWHDRLDRIRELVKLAAIKDAR